MDQINPPPFVSGGINRSGASRQPALPHSSLNRNQLKDRDTDSLSTLTHDNESAISTLTPSVRNNVNQKDIVSLTSSNVADKLHFSTLPQLYGRDEPQKQLEDIFEHTETCRNFVLIRGDAGVGKSALAMAISPFVHRKGGFFMAGKFDQQKRDQPYKAISSACQQLVSDLSSQREEEGLFLREREKAFGPTSLEDDELMTQNVDQSRSSASDIVTKLRETFNSEEIVILETVIPNLDLLLGETPIVNTSHEQLSSRSNSRDLEEEPDLEDSKSGRNTNYLDAKERFFIAFKRFLRLFSSFGTIALVLDDLQWADVASLQLMKALLLDYEQTSLMMLGLIRNEGSEESNSNASLKKVLEDIENSFDPTYLRITNISLTNLSKQDVTNLLTDLLLSKHEEVASLATLVHEKTAGNVFYLKQFLLSLQSGGLLEYSFGTMSWQYSLDKIRTEASAADNVVDLLKAKLKKLPPSLQAMLPRLACLGDRFLESMFELVAIQLSQENSIDTDTKARSTAAKEKCAAELLDLCKREGILIDCKNGWLKWEHDRIQEAALFSVDQNHRQATQFTVGEFLLANLSTRDLSEALFVVTNLLNSGIEGLSANDPRRRTIAEVNLRAGKAASSSSAYGDASNYLLIGVDLLPKGDEKWSSPDFKELSLDMYSCAAEARLCSGSGSLENMKALCYEVLSLQDVPLLAKKRVYNVSMHFLASDGRSSGAMKMCLDILGKLGCTFPSHGKTFFAAAGIIRTTSTLTASIEKIKMLPVVSKEETEWVFYLLDRLITYSYQSDVNLLPLAILKGHRWIVNHGKAEYTSPLLATIALMLSASLGDFDGGRKYAELALNSMSFAVQARTLFVTHYFVLHWVQSFASLKAPIREAIEIGMRSGDLESALWCKYCELDYLFL